MFLLFPPESSEVSFRHFFGGSEGLTCQPLLASLHTTAECPTLRQQVHMCRPPVHSGGFPLVLSWQPSSSCGSNKFYNLVAWPSKGMTVPCIFRLPVTSCANSVHISRSARTNWSILMFWKRSDAWLYFQLGIHDLDRRLAIFQRRLHFVIPFAALRRCNFQNHSTFMALICQVQQHVARGKVMRPSAYRLRKRSNVGKTNLQG